MIGEPGPMLAPLRDHIAGLDRNIRFVLALDRVKMRRRMIANIRRMAMP
jgi:hypothetical protein